MAVDRLLRAAFGDEPGADVAALLAADAPTPRRRWLAAVVLGGQGRYAAAHALLTPLLAGQDRVIGALAACALASHRRQLGGHAPARALDGRALALLATAGHWPHRPVPGTDPDGVDAAGALADAMLGLAADAIGLGRVVEARRLLAVVNDMGDDMGDEMGAACWRARVRRGWVNAELALASGDPEEAVAVAETAVLEAKSIGARRHVIKSEALLAAALVSMATERDRIRSIGLLEGIMLASLERGMLPLTWPSARLLADLVPEAADRCRHVARRSLICVLSRTDPDGVTIATCSPWMPVSS